MHKLSVHEDIKNQCDQCDFNSAKNKTTSRSISNMLNVITNLNKKVTQICINCLYMMTGGSNEVSFDCMFYLLVKCFKINLNYFLVLLILI